MKGLNEMAAVAIQQPLLRQSPTPPPHPPSLTLDASRFASAPIPNKHIPYCSPGPAPSPHHRALVTPPASPRSKHASLQASSLLHPVDQYTKIIHSPPVYSINATTLAAALENLASQTYPDPKQVFPWLHGLHPENQVQQAFFIARRKTMKTTPKCFRGITIVKAGGDLSRSKLKGAFDGEELLDPCDKENGTFLETDPRDGFSVRNFHIQAAKMARVSDIVVYGDDSSINNEVQILAKRIANAQTTWTIQLSSRERDVPKFNTFILSSPFRELESNHSELVAIDSRGQTTGNVMDFFQWERQEMCSMSKVSEISQNVWLGPTPDVPIQYSSGREEEEEEDGFDILIETSDLAQVPDLHTLNRIGEQSYSAPQYLEFPSSGSITPPRWPAVEIDPLTEMCRWIYQMANPRITPDTSEDERDSCGDIPMRSLFPSARKILIHCVDGYTESSLLALAYLMYAEGIPVHDAWLRLHCEKKRNFFAYPSDVSLLVALQPRILELSERAKTRVKRALRDEPTWLSRIDGSLPSRILPYMYLGNLGHANNPDLLKALGIKRVLSVGETVMWTRSQLEKWGSKNLLYVDRVQDNGVDPLMNEFEKCLDFIGKAKLEGTATLVHCRVGVSRSATICIAEVMASLRMSFPRAYCFVRARRLNVIIQPHLRFAYELLKWDELQQQRRGEPVRRELEWATIAREIAAMNKPYSR